MEIIGQWYALHIYQRCSGGKLDSQGMKNYVSDGMCEEAVMDITAYSMQ